MIRTTGWLAGKILEESGEKRNVHDSYVYNWRTFSDPANSSVNNAVELGNRAWNGCGNRRAVVDEAQEVKAVYDTLQGQTALQIIRQNPDLYRQLPSRYILVGHSMGGVFAREYVQNSNYYHGDVDKIITLYLAPSVFERKGKSDVNPKS